MALWTVEWREAGKWVREKRAFYSRLEVGESNQGNLQGM